MALVIVLAAGGTGGHIFPAIALAEAIRKHSPDAEVHFLGPERGAQYVRAAGYPLALVPARPVVGRSPLAALRGLASLARGVWIARRTLTRLGADLVIGVGGYASVPGVAAALSLRTPSALLEADAEPGRANRLLGRFVRKVFVQFDDARAHFPADRVEALGFPVRAIPRRAPRAGDSPLHLLVVGGSQGARSVNRAVVASLPVLAAAGLRVTHQTGPHDLDEVRAAYASAGVEGDVAAFFDDLPERLASADLVVARAGASTVAEICLAGVASILVPYPHAAGGHQMRNAREVERDGACVVIPDAEVGERLGAEVGALAADPARRRSLAEAALRRAAPDAAEQIWDACRALLEESA